MPAQVVCGGGSFSTLHPHSSQGGQVRVRAERRQRASPGSSLLGALLRAARGAKVFVLEVGPNLEKVTVDRLKPHTGPLPVVPAVPAKRGRPRKNMRVSSYYPIVHPRSSLVLGGAPVEARNNCIVLL